MTGVALQVISEETNKKKSVLEKISAGTHFEPAQVGTRIDKRRVTSLGV